MKNLVNLVGVILVTFSILCFGEELDSTKTEADLPLVAQFQLMLEQIDSLIEAQEWEEAERLANNCISFTENKFGDLDSLTGNAWRKLSKVFYLQGKYDKMELPLRNNAEIIKLVFGNKGNEYAAAIETLGVCLFYLGKYSDAESVFYNVVKIRKVILSPNDPDLAEAFNNLVSFIFLGIILQSPNLILFQSNHLYLFSFSNIPANVLFHNFSRLSFSRC